MINAGRFGRAVGFCTVGRERGKAGIYGQAPPRAREGVGEGLPFRLVDQEGRVYTEGVMSFTPVEG